MRTRAGGAMGGARRSGVCPVCGVVRCPVIRRCRASADARRPTSLCGKYEFGLGQFSSLITALAHAVKKPKA